MLCSGNGVEPARGDRTHGRPAQTRRHSQVGNITTVPPSRLLLHGSLNDYLYTVQVATGGPDGTTRVRPTPLSRQRLVDEALALLEEPGGGELSMRRLAQRLGVAPNALYTYVRDKADLVSALVDEVYADLDLVPHASDHWTG